MKRVFVLGSLNMDLVIQTDVFPNEGETVAGHDFKTAIGGKGLNQAIAAAKLGAPVVFLGAVGNDEFSKKLISALGKWNINTSFIKTIYNKSSGVAMIILNNSNNRIVLDLGANLEISKEDVDKFLSIAIPGDIFVTQLENNLDAIKYAIKLAKEKGMTIILNPAPANKEISDVVKYADFFVPNETEYKLLKDSIGEDTNLLLTKGKNGYSYFSKGIEISGIAPKVNVVDTVGAGDCFIGALAYVLSKEESIKKETLDFVCKAASISTTKTGSSDSSPTLQEVLNFN